MISLLNDTDMLELRAFKAETISPAALNKIMLLSRKVRKDILSMVKHAGSGHVGGSFSSTDIYLMLWLCADISPEKIYQEERDRIVISHGHTSPGLYAVLGNFGFFDVQEAVENFRTQGSIFEGHPYCRVPGVEWGSGSLGQGLSVGCGFALAAKIQQFKNRVFVVMGDGEQQKGQITEACEFAAKHGLSNLTAIIDINKLQASGSTADIMPADLQKKYESCGWETIAINGHDHAEIYQALKKTSRNGKPIAILAHTIMGKGFAAIENNYEYHGRLLSGTQYEEAIAELSDTDQIKMLPLSVPKKEKNKPVEHQVNAGNAIVYETGKMLECRAAAGEAVYDIIRINRNIPVVVVDCDLMESVKTLKVSKDFPAQFIECGIQEHNAATLSGALSKAGLLPFFLDFGVFGIDETYGQHRMNDMNETSLKLIVTHCGLDVGEDGKTHQCIDYISLTNNLPGYQLIVPADANQTDQVIRYIASTPGNFVVALGRSKVPVIHNQDGEPFYDTHYSFSYGSSDWIRQGHDATIISTGTMVHRAVKAAEALATENIQVGVLNISCPAKIDLNAIKKACRTGTVVTYEDHFVQSGIGSLVASIIAENEWHCRFKKMGVSKYGKSCAADLQYVLQDMDIDALKKTIKQLNNKKLTVWHDKY